MKSLKSHLSPKKYVSELNGYLKAVCHLNDEMGYRHDFQADFFELKGIPPEIALKEYLNISEMNIKEIDSIAGRLILKKYIFNNFLMDIHIHEKYSKKIKLIKEQIVWHIQEYIAIVGLKHKIIKRWLIQYYDNEKKFNYSFIVICFNDSILIVILGYYDGARSTN